MDNIKYIMLSIVIPIYNEEENLAELFSEIKEVAQQLSMDYEVIAINDGSTDKSMSVLADEAKKDGKIKVINFYRNFGQTAAMSAGFRYASGDIVIPMDADLQNDPHDIPRLLEIMNQGYDIVSGWRKDRKDNMITRKFPSYIANFVISKITGVYLHDYGCTIKAYKKIFLNNTKLYGEMHRFIPALAVWQGAHVTEIIVNHRARKHEKTKYGISRTFRVILDLLTVKFLTKYSTRPMHFFGGAGIILFFLGFVSGILAVYLRIARIATLIQTPLPLLSVFFFMIGAQMILMGLLAEMIMRNYYEGQNKEVYIIKEKINL